ncbi:MAG: hypothetical protein ATN35_05820 [Epulopiscium sp. Nele67-Bin004]|nr:MAG: hypothetical protein ATN35_05820 [Epulopiscium sp. Nele67-Bin004]
MRINYNIPALKALTFSQKNNAAQESAMIKLSSGLQINSSKDDPAGMAISNKMRAQIDGLSQASSNSMDAISLIQTAEGALGEISEMLSRVRELAIQSATDTYSDDDREKLQVEVDELLKQIDQIVADSEFNQNSLLAGGETIPDSGITFEQIEIGNSTTAAVFEVSFPTVIEEGTGFTLDGEIYVFTDDVANYDGEGIPLDRTEDIASQIAALELDRFDVAVSENGVTLTAKEEGFGGNYVPGYDGALLAKSFIVQTGANANQSTTIEILGASTLMLGLTSTTGGVGYADYLLEPDNPDNDNVYGLSMLTAEDAEYSLTAIDEAINTINQQRAYLGAYQTRLEYTVKNLDSTDENLTSALSRIQDTDMAEMMTEFTRTNILAQAANSMISQANQRPQQVLQILQS